MPETLEREFTIHHMRWQIQGWPRSLLEQQFISLLQGYLQQQDAMVADEGIYG